MEPLCGFRGVYGSAVHEPLTIMSHQHFRGTFLFGPKRLCPTDQYCAFSATPRIWYGCASEAFRAMARTRGQEFSGTSLKILLFEGNKLWVRHRCFNCSLG